MEPFVRTVQITNYKSISRCRVDLGPLTFLVGPNGSGKSNFLDALRFVADSLNTTLEQSLRDRGGIQSVRRRSRGHPTHFGICVDVNLPDGRGGAYSFKVGAERDGAFVVQREECRVSRADGFDDFFVVEEGKVQQASQSIPAALERDRLALVAISGLPEFRLVYESLRRMAFYNLNPERIRDLQEPDSGQMLARGGKNLAAVIRELGRFGGGHLARAFRGQLVPTEAELARRECRDYEPASVLVGRIQTERARTRDGGPVPRRRRRQERRADR